MKRPLLIVGFLVRLALTGQAHAFLEHATPGVGQTVARAPAELTILFTDGVDLAGSSVQVLNEAGQEVDKRDLHLDARDEARVHLSLPPLPAGKYRVVWRARCPQHHVTQGQFSFQVAPK